MYIIFCVYIYIYAYIFIFIYIYIYIYIYIFLLKVISEVRCGCNTSWVCKRLLHPSSQWETCCILSRAQGERRITGTEWQSGADAHKQQQHVLTMCWWPSAAHCVGVYFGLAQCVFSIYVLLCVWIYVCVSVCVCRFMSEHVWLCICAYVLMCVFVYACGFEHVCVRVPVSVCV